MNKHTPGPWKADPYGMNVGHDHGEGNQEKIEAAPPLDACKWLLFHAENGRRKRTVTTLWLDFSEDEFEGRLRTAIKAAERRKP